MVHNITYRGIDIKITLDSDTGLIEYTKNSIDYTIKYLEMTRDRYTKSIQIFYAIMASDSEGNQISNTQHKIIADKKYHDIFYNMISINSMGQTLDRGPINIILEELFK